MAHNSLCCCVLYSPPGYRWLHVQINCRTPKKGMQIGAKTLSNKLKSSSLQGFIETISHCWCCVTGMGDYLLSVLVWVTMTGINHRRDQAMSANVSQSFFLPSGVTPYWCVDSALTVWSLLVDWSSMAPCRTRGCIIHVSLAGEFRYCQICFWWRYWIGLHKPSKCGVSVVSLHYS